MYQSYTVGASRGYVCYRAAERQGAVAWEARHDWFTSSLSTGIKRWVPPQASCAHKERSPLQQLQVLAAHPVQFCDIRGMPMHKYARVDVTSVVYPTVVQWS